MELSPLLQHLVDTAFKVAQDQFREGKEVLPQITLLAEDDDGFAIVPILSTVHVADVKDKTRFVKKLVDYAWAGILKERPNLTLLALTIMLDTWIRDVLTTEVAAELAQGRYKSPSQSIGSTEAIVVQITTVNDGEMWQWPYVKSGKEVVFSGKPERSEIAGCLFNDLWPL